MQPLAPRILLLMTLKRIEVSEAQKGRVWKYIQSGNGENARGFHHAADVEPFDFVFVCICCILMMFILIIV